MSAANIAEALVPFSGAPLTSVAVDASLAHRADWPEFALYRPHPSRAALAAALDEALATTRKLWTVIDDAGLAVPLLPIVNPPLWELGHIAWFAEFWVHRRGDFGAKSIIGNADTLYDSSNVPHDSRWTLPMPDRDATWAYVERVHARTLDALDEAADPLEDELAYFVQLALLHHDMHNEAFTYMWHTFGYPAPWALAPKATRAQGDVRIDAGRVELGARPGTGFVFDNEKWAHPVDVAAFSIARRPVTNDEYAAFVDAGGPVPRYWKRDNGRWRLRRYDGWVDLPLDEPVMHVSWDEASAYCRWAGRRLPTEAEWQLAAPQMDHGQVWEWTASRFVPFEGFSPDPYRDYSAPWFAEDHRVLRGGSFATPRRLARPGFRNFFKPARADVFCGFRTCALEERS
jgi:iron(II)-dependent oxidoreductase